MNMKITLCLLLSRIGIRPFVLVKITPHKLLFWTVIINNNVFGIYRGFCK